MSFYEGVVCGGILSPADKTCLANLAENFVPGAGNTDLSFGWM
jgi:hypothetical protein